MPKLESERSRSVWRAMWFVVLCVLTAGGLCLDALSHMGYELQWAMNCIVLVMWGGFTYMPLPLIKTRKAQIIWVGMCSVFAIMIVLGMVFPSIRF